MQKYKYKFYVEEDLNDGRGRKKETLSQAVKSIKSNGLIYIETVYPVGAQYAIFETTLDYDEVNGKSEQEIYNLLDKEVDLKRGNL